MLDNFLIKNALSKKRKLKYCVSMKFVGTFVKSFTIFTVFFKKVEYDL